MEELNFLPSEIARLVLGYLSDEGYVNSYKCFIKECPHLQEYLKLKKQGRNYPLYINGMTLNQMLQKYAQFTLIDSQKRQTMGTAVLWSQLDGVIRTLKEQTSCKLNRGPDGLTQSTRVRRMMLENKRRRGAERRKKKLDLCSRTPATTAKETSAGTSEERELEMDAIDTGIAEEEGPPEGGSCRVLTLPTDSDNKEKSGRGRKSLTDTRRYRDTDDRETEFILHSAPPSVSSHIRQSSLQKSSSVSDLLSTSAVKLQGLQGNRTKRTTVDETITKKHPQNVEGRSTLSHFGAAQSRGVKGPLHGSLEMKDQEHVLEERGVGADDRDNFPSECSHVFDNVPPGVAVQSNTVLSSVASSSEIRLQTQKGNSQDIGNSKCVTTDVQKTHSNDQSIVSPKPIRYDNDQSIVSLKPFRCDNDHKNNVQVLGGVLEGLPVVDSLQQTSTSPHQGMKDQVDHGIVPQTSSGENSQDSSESQQPKSLERMTPFLKALNLSETIHSPPHIPLEQTDEVSQMSTGRTPRRKRQPNQKKNPRKGGNLNNSNKNTDENSLLMENITLFMTEFLNNPSLHERLAENINRTLSQRTDEKRSRKKSGKTTKGVTSDKSDKLEITSIHEEAESNCNQSLDSQGLTAFLDDILNLNETQMTEAQIGGIIEITSKDPSFESLFHLFHEPHSATENQKTDFSGIKLEMGKEASITNTSLPSFTEPIDCPEPSRTSSEENLIMEILQSPLPGPSQNSSYQQDSQTAEAQKSDSAVNSSLMEWNPAHPNQSTTTRPASVESRAQNQPGSRNIFESFQVTDKPSILANAESDVPLHDQQSEQIKTGENVVAEDKSPKAPMLPLQNSIPSASGQDIGGSHHQSVCRLVSNSSGSSGCNNIKSCTTVATEGTCTRPIISRADSTSSPSIQKEFSQIGSPSVNIVQVPCHSPQFKSPDVLSSPLQQPFTKLTDKVNVSCDTRPKKNSMPSSTTQNTNKLKSPIQNVEPAVFHHLPKQSQECIIHSPSPVSDRSKMLSSPHSHSEQLSTLPVNSPHSSVQTSDIQTDFQKTSVVNSPIKCLSSVKQTDSEQCNVNKNTCERPNHSKSGKFERKIKFSSRKDRTRERLVSKSTKNQSDPNLVETFETSVTETHGFPVISIKSVLKSPEQTSRPSDRILPAVTDSACQQVSYRSFIGGVTGEECSTPVTERSEARDSPHTCHSGANSGLLSEMMDFVSTLEKSLGNGNSSIEKSGDQESSGKKSSNKKKKKQGKKESETSLTSPKKMPQWSPDLKALLKLVTPEKKEKPKRKRSAKVISSAEKRRNPRRKVQRRNEESFEKGNTPSELSPLSSSQKIQSPVVNQWENNTEPVSEVIDNPEPVSEVIDNPEGNTLSMPTMNNFMSTTVQVKSLENDVSPDSVQQECGVSDEVGLTPKTILTAVSALKDNKSSSRKCLQTPSNVEQGTEPNSKELSTVQSCQSATQPISSPERQNTQGSKQTFSVGQNEGTMVENIEKADYSRIMYSPNRDFLASPSRYESPGIGASHGNLNYGGVGVSTVSSHPLDSSSLVVPHASQIITPPPHALTDTVFQKTPTTLSDSGNFASGDTTLYTGGMTFLPNSVSYQGQVLSDGDQAVTYSTVYLDNNGIPTVIQTDSAGHNVVPTHSALQGAVPLQPPVTDILSVAASMITPSPLQTMDGDQLISTPDGRDKQESVGQLIAIPVGRYYPEKKLHVRSLDFGPDAGTVEIRTPGYGRGHKKKTYDNVENSAKPGGLVNKKVKGKAKSAGCSKGKASVDRGNQEMAMDHANAPVNVVEKKEEVKQTVSKSSEKSDFIPDASGSIYIVEGNTRKKIRVNKKTKTVSPLFRSNGFDQFSNIVSVKQEIYKKGRNITVPAGVAMPVLDQLSTGSAENEADCDVDVDGDWELPDLPPEPPRNAPPRSKCSEYVQRPEYQTPVKLSSVGDSACRKQPSSVNSDTDSCDSNSGMQLDRNSEKVTTRPTTMDSDSPCVRGISGRSASVYGNNSNSLPDLESPMSLINTSTPPKKRITASLKHGGGCYFFSSASQEAKHQATSVESRECDTTKEIVKVVRSPRTPKGKQTPAKTVRQSPRLIGSPSRMLRSMTTPTKANPQESASPKSVERKKRVKRLREVTVGEPSKMQRKGKKAQNDKKAVDLSKVDFEKFLNKIHKI